MELKTLLYFLYPMLELFSSTSYRNQVWLGQCRHRIKALPKPQFIHYLYTIHSLHLH